MVENINAAEERAHAGKLAWQRTIEETPECCEWPAAFARATADGIDEKLKKLIEDSLNGYSQA